MSCAAQSNRARDARAGGPEPPARVSRTWACYGSPWTRARPRARYWGREGLAAGGMCSEMGDGRPGRLPLLLRHGWLQTASPTFVGSCFDRSRRSNGIRIASDMTKLPNCDESTSEVLDVKRVYGVTDPQVTRELCRPAPRFGTAGTPRIHLAQGTSPHRGAAVPRRSMLGRWLALRQPERADQDHPLSRHLRGGPDGPRGSSRLRARLRHTRAARQICP